MDAGFDHSEPLARAFRGEQGQSPIQFTHKPGWRALGSYPFYLSPGRTKR